MTRHGPLGKQLKMRDAAAALADGAHQSEAITPNFIVVDHDEHFFEVPMQGWRKRGDRRECLAEVLGFTRRVQLLAETRESGEKSNLGGRGVGCDVLGR